MSTTIYVLRLRTLSSPIWNCLITRRLFLKVGAMNICLIKSMPQCPIWDGISSVVNKIIQKYSILSKHIINIFQN